MHPSLSNWHARWDGVLFTALDACEQALIAFQQNVHLTAPCALAQAIRHIREAQGMQDVPGGALPPDWAGRQKGTFRVPPGYITVKEAETKSGINDNVIRLAIHSGELPFVKTDRMVIPLKEFNKWAKDKMK